MPIDNPNVVDGIGLERASGIVVLTISDHLDWSDERGHFEAIQNKVNSYLDFVESGQIYEAYPDARDRQLRIEIIRKFDLPASATPLFDEIRRVAMHYNLDFSERLLPQGY